MKLTADRSALLKALAHVQSVVERRNTIPILANVLIAVRDGKLTLTATDMEITIVEDVPATTLRNGACTALASTLYDIVRKLPENAEVELDHPGGDGALTLRSGRYSTNLVVLPVEDFPTMVTGTLPHKFSLPAQVLRGLIDRTRFAISTEETRYYLNGIYLHVVETEGRHMLRAVATDGHRLARVEEPAPDGSASIPGVIIPRKTINELRKLLDEITGEVAVALSDTRIQFEANQILLTSKLIDGTFPDYQRVIPRNNDRMLRVGKRDLSDAVARVAAISSERSRPVKLSLSKGSLVVSASSPEHGTATEELDGDAIQFDSAPLEIGFQARYLNDITDQIETNVEFAFADGGSPTIVRDVAEEGTLYVLMPMRV